ncbi:MAG: L-threonylcarbamoyladenylate synthase [Spirochaetales bacterium]|nr:L-threonylcarbamoyladenylate synthase [Spirochaetales bacterium]MCF7938219.1 L-threonylcarbamoyladenylate synthase [Spirochaetales bacterium]
MLLPVGDQRAVSKAVEYCTDGKVVILPTDTIYGFHGLVPGSEDIIRDLKGRGEDSPFLQLLPSVEWFMRMSAFKPDSALLELWPGPLTLVTELKDGESVAYRVPAAPFMSEFLSKLKAPVYSTSVNRSGEPPMNRINDIFREFGKEVPLIVDAGDRLDSKPSTLVDIRVEPYRILRQGSCEIPLSLIR